MRQRGKDLRANRKYAARWRRAMMRGMREALKRGLKVVHTYRDSLVEPGVIAMNFGSSGKSGLFRTVFDVVYHPEQRPEDKYYRSIPLRRFLA